MSTGLEGKDQPDLASLQQRLFQVAYMMLGDQSAAEDVSQETILRVVEHRESFRGEGDFDSWAYTIAVNLCRSKRREKRKTPVPIDQTLLDRTSLQNPGQGPSTKAVLQETYEKAAVAVRSLSFLLREAFVLHYIENLPYSVVAAIVGITEGAARLRAMRAREALVAELASYLSPEVHRAMKADVSKTSAKNP